MQVSVYLLLLLASGLAALAPRLPARFAPARAAKILTGLAAASAACTIWGLGLLGLTLIATTPMAAETGVDADPVPAALAVVATGLLAAGLGRAVLTAARRRSIQRAMREVCAMCADHGELAVVSDDTPQAFAVPGRARGLRGPGQPGRILVSTGLLRAATPAERRVVLAHERAHLHYRHHRHQAIVDLAAAINPLLAKTKYATVFLLERWADEAAASVTNDRQGTARALATVALASRTATSSRATLAFHHHGVLERVRALQVPAPSQQPRLAYLLIIPTGLSILTASDATLALARLLHPLLSHLAG